MIDSAEASAEASVKVTEASVSAETNFSRFGRSLYSWQPCKEPIFGRCHIRIDGSWKKFRFRPKPIFPVSVVHYEHELYT